MSEVKVQAPALAIHTLTYIGLGTYTLSMAVVSRTVSDPLTGLPGRDAFETALTAALAAVRKRGGSVSAGIVDIDLFGAVNKTHGHEVGDAVLAHLGASLADTLDDAATVYRFGGDAFGVLLPETEKERAFLAVESFRTCFDREHAIAGAGTLALTTSIGLAACPDDGDKAADLIQKANEALYRAKVSGRNKVCLAREEKMVTKTSHYTQGQLMGLRRLAEREGIGEAVLLREGLNDLLRKYNA